MTVTVANLPYSFCPSSSSQSNQGFMFKNAYDAWFYNTATSQATQITDTDYPSARTYNLSSLGTSQTATVAKKTFSNILIQITSGTVATGTTSEAHHMQVGDTIEVVAFFGFLTGTFTVASVPTTTTFTYAISTGSFIGGVVYGTVTGGRDVVVTTETAHTLAVGNSAVITDNATYAGTYTITKVPTTSTYEFTSTVATNTSGTATSTSSSSTMAIGVTETANTITVGGVVSVTGATPSAYNVTLASVKYVSGTRIGFTFGGGTSPATGAIQIVAGTRTVPGIVYLDSTFYVMGENAVIYGSDLNNALSWNALNFITAQIEPGAGKALAKSQNYVIAFKEWSTEFFFDNANSTGSPLSVAGNGFNLIGCASGDSVATLDGALFWVSQTRQKGRGVHMMVGLDDQKISTPDVERILNLSSLATVYSYGVRIAGHAFYVLTLTDQNITLVYDLSSKVWSQWSSLTLGTPVSVSSITLSGTTATVTTAAAHNLTDGDPVNIAGANQAAYNGIKVISYVDSTHYTFETTAGTTTPATGTITSTPYTETYFKYTKYINALGKDLVQHETNGTLCELVETAYQDVGVPVNVIIRTGKFDGGTMNFKRFNTVEVIGNKVSGTAYIRFSDDDYQTNSKYRPVDLSLSRSLIRRCGSARRRSHELRYLGATSLQVGALELDVV